MEYGKIRIVETPTRWLQLFRVQCKRGSETMSLLHCHRSASPQFPLLAEYLVVFHQKQSLLQSFVTLDWTQPELFFHMDTLISLPFLGLAIKGKWNFLHLERYFWSVSWNQVLKRANLSRVIQPKPTTVTVHKADQSSPCKSTRQVSWKNNRFSTVCGILHLNQSNLTTKCLSTLLNCLFL